MCSKITSRIVIGKNCLLGSVIMVFSLCDSALGPGSWVTQLVVKEDQNRLQAHPTTDRQVIKQTHVA